MSLLKITELSKSFGQVAVLRSISFDLEKGEILGLVGENGAGKSTLMRCICGILKPNGGSIDFNGKAYLVPQELTFIDSMSIAENLFLGREKTKFGLVVRRELFVRTEEALAKIGAERLSPNTLMSALGVADRQKVAIAKALIERADLLILDEPTAVLSQAESEHLFKVLRALQAEGVGIIYISHKLDEVLSLCTKVSILRDGYLIESGPSAQYTTHRLAELMVGRPLSEIYPPHQAKPDPVTPFLLEADALSDGKVVKEASFSIRRGEILGLAGLAGAGRTELAELICGMRKRTAGTLLFNGEKRLFKSMRDAQKHGIAYLSEDRQGTALLVDSEIAENAALASLEKYQNGPLLSRKRILTKAEERVKELSIRCAAVTQPVRALSGGNQQKVAIAKGLDVEPLLYIFDEPTRGVDVGARAEIYSIIRSLADTGVAILMISSDLSEILGNCRRSLVMHEGRIVGSLEDEELTEQNVMILASGLDLMRN